MTLDEQAIRDALRGVHYPGFGRDLVTLGIVQGIRLRDDLIEVELSLGPGQEALRGPIERMASEALRPLPNSERVRFRLKGRPGAPSGLKMAGTRPSTAASGALDVGLIPGVRHAVAIASGKGGVGKSTIAVNLAVALARGGARVGLLDADVYGPSIPLMTGIDSPAELTAERKLVPFERFGVRIMSLGFLVDPASAVIWRGPMVMKALEQLLREVIWGELDYLLIDMPPGTGDAQLTLSQRIRLAGAVIVTTPQDVALADARKGVSMFKKVDVPILGIIENMSYFECPHCSERTEIFGHGGGRREAERMQVPFLGEIPLDPDVRAGGDSGHPFAEGDSARSRAIAEIAASVRATVEKEGDAPSTPPPGGVFERFRQAFRSESD